MSLLLFSDNEFLCYHLTGIFHADKINTLGLSAKINGFVLASRNLNVSLLKNHTSESIHDADGDRFFSGIKLQGEFPVIRIRIDLESIGIGFTDTR